MPAAPLISIVIVCRNPGSRLASAFGTITAQSFRDFELVVIDGGSTDGTVSWLESRRADLACLVSESDRGVYHAMNKGAGAARGAWILFLGADDRLADERVLERAAGALASSPAGVVGGAARYLDGRIYRFRSPVRPAARNFLHHQAAFFHRGLFADFGGFDETLRVAADYDFNLRLWKAGVSFVPVALMISECGIGGVSDAGNWVTYREEIAVRHRHLSGPQCMIWDALSVVRYFRKRFIRCLVHA